MFTLQKNKYYSTESFWMKYGRSDSAVLHTHDFLELVYIIKGHSVHTIDGTEYPVKEGDMLFINLGSTHKFEAPKPVAYVDITFKPEFINDGLLGSDNAFALLELDDFKDFDKIINREGKHIRFSVAERRRIEGLINFVLEEQISKSPGKDLVLRSVFNTLLVLVFRKMALPMAKESGISEALLSRIKACCGSSLTLEAIATENHYSPAYFSRLFKRCTGVTFTEYLTTCRIELAKKLLTETDISVSDVCTECGFTDRTKFFKTFSDRVGTTPLKFRKSKK